MALFTILELVAVHERRQAKINHQLKQIEGARLGLDGTSRLLREQINTTR
jgi:hypothetical protein